MATPIRAADVEVVTVRRACCRRPDCDWKGEHRPTYQEAAEDRQAHLDWHRQNVPADADEQMALAL